MPNLETIDLSINTNYAVLISAIILGILYTLYIYKYTIPETTKLLKSILIVIRAAALSLILFLLFEPSLLLKYNESIEPVNLVLVDNSHSIAARDSTNRVKLIADFINDYSQKVDEENKYYTFSSIIDTITNPDELNINFDGSKTNFEQIVNFIKDSKQNIASATIISDGIINEGSSSPTNFEQIGIPIYTVSIGDTTVRTDLGIKKVIYNDLIYSNSPTELQVVLFNKHLSDKLVTLFLYEDSKLIDQMNVKLDSSGFNNIAFSYTPNFPGERVLNISVSMLENEETFENNKYPFVVNILNDKIRLLLISGSPSYDYRIMKQILKENKNITVEEIIQITPNKFLPDSKFEGKIDSADIYLMIDFPTQHSPHSIISKLTNTIKKNNKSFFFVLSQSVDQKKLMSLDIDLPFGIQNYSSQFKQVNLLINSKSHPIISSSIAEWNDLPPIFQTNSKIKVIPGNDYLAYSKYKNTKTDAPLIILGNISKTRSIVLNGFEVWRWKLQSNSRAAHLLDTFLNNSIKWLYSDKQDKRIFVSPIKKVFKQNDEIEFRASIYDETLTPRNDAAVTINVSNQNENYNFELKSIGNGLYEGKLNNRGTGNFNYKSIIQLDEKNIVGPSGKFIISDINIENINYVLNENYLKLLTNITSGKSFKILDYKDLFDNLNFNQKNRVVTNVSRVEYKIWNSEWILGLIVFLFSIEWFLRKRKGLL